MPVLLRPRWQPGRKDLFVWVILLLAGVKYTYGLNRVLDVTLYDESSYLHAGAALMRIGLPAAEAGPLYAPWYYLLSLAQPDLVSLYYLNHALTTVLPPLFLYALLRVTGASVIAGALLAASFLITQANFVTWPRPSHFALLIVLTSLAVALNVRRLSGGTFLLAAGTLLAAFVRPEYLLAFLLLLAAGAIRLVVEHRRGEAPPRAWALPGAVLLMACVLLAKLGLPAFGRGGGTRHFYAFTQHFALNWATWTHLDPYGPYNPATNFREIAAGSFGDAHSVGEAFRRNPSSFARHVATNLRTALPRFPGLFLHHENVFLPPGKWFENLEARLTLVALVAWAGLRRRAWLPFLGENLRRHRRLLVWTALLCVPGAISIVEIYPHDHYMLLPGALLIVAVAALLRGQVPTDPTPPPGPAPRRLALLGLGILATVPALSRGPAVETPIARTIRSLASLRITEPVRLLDAEGGYDYYLPANYQRVPEYDKNSPFEAFLSTSGINLIVLTGRLERDSRFANDPSWQTFLEHPQEAGFEARPVPGGGVTLLVERRLLSSAGQIAP